MLSHHPDDWQLYYHLKKECQKEFWTACNNYINSYLDSRNGQTTKKFWSFIKSNKKDQCNIPPINCNQEILTDSHLKSNALNDYFTSVFIQEDLCSLPKMNNSPFPEISNISVSEGVANLLNNLTTHKATRPDSILHIFLRNYHMKLYLYWLKIFNPHSVKVCCLQNGNLPMLFLFLRRVIVPRHVITDQSH